ncbi:MULTISPECIES: hypothetical protein [Streptomycetaceae]|nr:MULTISPECIES: hypothetical protein [Streptomycetaceae]MYS59288.1 hypothetical protein [Streptomyces sp. SID5468]
MAGTQVVAWLLWATGIGLAWTGVCWGLGVFEERRERAARGGRPGGRR